MSYKTLNANCIIRLVDNQAFPAKDGNADYEEFKRWVALGNTALPADPPTPEELAVAASRTKTATDIIAAKAYTKLTAWTNMTPIQQQAWFAANVTNPAQAQDALLTLGIAVGILWRERAGL